MIIADSLKSATWASGLAHLLNACVELGRASNDLNEVNDYVLKSPDAPLTVKEWHAIFRAHKRLLATYRQLNARAVRKNAFSDPTTPKGAQA